MKNIILGLSVVLAAFGLTNCSGTDESVNEQVSSTETTNDHTQKAEPSEYLVRLKPEQMKVMDIKIGKFKQMNLTSTIKSNGQLELPPQNKASLSSVVSGRVKDVKVIAGEEVRKGQILAVMENPEVIDLQQEYLAMKSKHEYLKNQFERKDELYQDSIGSAKEYQRVKSEYESSAAILSGLEAKLRLLNFSKKEMDDAKVSSTFNVIAPISGFVRMVEINIGKFVQPEQELFEIVDNDHIHIDLMVFEKDVDKVKEGMKVVFSISTHPENVFNGQIFSVGKAFESDLKAVKVHADITSKPTGLLPGMYVNARIIIDSNDVQAVPNSAIIEQEGLSYIFVVNDAETDEHHTAFSKIEINRGAEDMGFVEVVPAQPIPKNPKVVINGAYYILAEMKKGEGGGHEH